MNKGRSKNVVVAIRKTLITEDDGIKRVKTLYARKRVKVEHIKLYGNHLHKLAKLSKCAMLLLLYSASESSDSTIFNNAVERSKFIKFCNTNCGILYSDNSVRLAYQELSKLHLLISYGKGVFTINPLFYFQGEESEREELVREVIKEAYSGKSYSADIKNALGRIIEFIKK